MPRLPFALSQFALLLACLATANAADDYQLGKDSMRQEGVPQGKVTEHEWKTSKVFPGTERKYWVYVPAQYDGSKPAAVMVFQDGQSFVSENGQYRMPIVFDNLIHKKEIPVTIGILINPGVIPPAEAGAQARRNRSYEYDRVSDDYARFLLEEILPEVSKTYKLTDDLRRPRDLRQQLRRHLRLLGRLASARCLPQSGQPHRQLH